jgi:hypothetical protein
MILCFNRLTTFTERARENEQDKEHSADEASPRALKRPKIPANARHPSQSDDDGIILLKAKKPTTAPARKTPCRFCSGPPPSSQSTLKKRNASSCVHAACTSRRPMPHPPACVPPAQDHTQRGAPRSMCSVLRVTLVTIEAGGGD